jgi:hypothetical protein
MGLLPFVRVANNAAIAQDERILTKIRDPEVIQVTRGIRELAGATSDVGPVVSRRHCHDLHIGCWIRWRQHSSFQRDRLAPRRNPIMLHVEGTVAVLSQDGGC